MPDLQILDFDNLWNYDDPATTERQFRQLLMAGFTIQDAAYRAQLLTQIARAQGLQRHFEAAHQTLDQAAKLLTPELMTARVRYLLERGRVFNSSEKVDQARPLFLQAFQLAQSAEEDFYAVDAAHMLAIVESGDEQLAWNLKALTLAEASEQPRAKKWLGSLYNNIGWTHHDAGRYDEALTIFEKALAWHKEYGKPSTLRIAKWSVARALRSLGRVDEALERQRALLVEHEQAGTSDGYVSEEIAECLLLLGKTDEARPHFARAYAELSQDSWLVENEVSRLERLKQLGT
ncbi:MAG: tetratricopeptide repeat protein [Chloroflexi bacterium]|nr:tetratricopeptide repeat protein [Chloroflexota bacterium]MCC6892185.1 tetratricopeptide repeat protein [Anaerolineae bacterium]